MRDPRAPLPGQRPHVPIRHRIARRLDGSLLPTWRLAHRLWSVRLNGLALAALGGWNMLPSQITDLLPSRVAIVIPAALVLAALAAQFVPQRKIHRGRHGHH